MDISFSARLQKSGTVLLPEQEAGAFASVDIVGALFCATDFPTVEVVTRLSKWKSRAFFRIPACLRKVLALPQCVEMVLRQVTDVDLPKKMQIIRALDGVVKFVAAVHGKRDRLVNLPTAWFRGMQLDNWKLSQVRIALTTTEDRYGFAREIVTSATGRKTPHGILYIPQKQIPVEVGQEVVVEITVDEGITPPKVFCTANGLLDWAAVIHKGSTRAVTQKANRLLVTGQRTSIGLDRYASNLRIFWLLGLYQAEGAKKTSGEFSLCNKSPEMLREVADVLVTDLGIQPDLIKLRIRYGPAVTELGARRIYKDVGVQHVSTYAPPIKEDNIPVMFCGEIAIRNSKNLARMWLSALDHFVQDRGFLRLPHKALKAFVVGYLDGDGSITALGQSAGLRLSAANEAEADAITQAIFQLYDRVVPLNDTHKTAAWDRLWTLSIIEAIGLLCAGAFKYSLSRVRLLHLVNVSEDVLIRRSCRGAASRMLREQGVVENGDLTPQAQEAIERRDRVLKQEMEYAFALYPSLRNAITGQKGVLYFYVPGSVVPVAQRDRLAQRAKAIRRKQLMGDPSVHHPREKRAQIHKVLEGLSGLSIYEAHGGYGYCTRAYKKHGQVTAKYRSSGDAQRVLTQEVTAGKYYDVVDLDPYGYPAKLLHGGVLDLFSEAGGFLFVTFPIPQKQYAPKAKPQLVRYFSSPSPTFDQVITSYVDYAAQQGRKLILVNRLDLPSVWRFCLQVSTDTSSRKRRRVII